MLFCNGHVRCIRHEMWTIEICHCHTAIWNSINSSIPKSNSFWGKLCLIPPIPTHTESKTCNLLFSVSMSCGSAQDKNVKINFWLNFSWLHYRHTMLRVIWTRLVRFWRLHLARAFIGILSETLTRANEVNFLSVDKIKKRKYSPWRIFYHISWKLELWKFIDVQRHRRFSYWSQLFLNPPYLKGLYRILPQNDG